MDAKDYTVRCDKCQFKPYVYCEMCMIRTKLQDAIETNRKTVQHLVASMQLCLNEINSRLGKYENRSNTLKDI